MPGRPFREIAPPDPFRALRLVPPRAVKVVVFGQDPYPRPGHADGLSDTPLLTDRVIRDLSVVVPPVGPK